MAVNIRQLFDFRGQLRRIYILQVVQQSGGLGAKRPRVRNVARRGIVGLDRGELVEPGLAAAAVGTFEPGRECAGPGIQLGLESGDEGVVAVPVVATQCGHHQVALHHAHAQGCLIGGFGARGGLGRRPGQRDRCQRGGGGHQDAESLSGKSTFFHRYAPIER
ncbi:MAG: hypothetical protein HQL37_01540 [Alphaproteobacteria bacterium]|nr:hypothetical protein [Alphaproteobacteria bacterium]